MVTIIGTVNIPRTVAIPRMVTTKRIDMTYSWLRTWFPAVVLTYRTFRTLNPAMVYSMSPDQVKVSA